MHNDPKRSRPRFPQLYPVRNVSYFQIRNNGTALYSYVSKRDVGSESLVAPGLLLTSSKVILSPSASDMIKVYI